jgi:putative ABC transport system permease protein
MWSGNVKSALSSLRQSRWRTTFTMMGIIIGISSVVTLVSLGEGLKKQVVGQVNQLGPNVVSIRPGKLLTKQGNLNLYAFLAPSTLTVKDVESLTNFDSVNTVAPVGFVTTAAGADSKELDSIFVAGTSPSLKAILHQKVAYGDFFSEDDGTGNFAVIGSDVANKLFGLLNPVGESIKIMGQDFIINGVLPPSSGNLLSVLQSDLNSSVFIPMGTAEELTSNHTNILQILIQLKPGANVNKSVSQINQLISKNHGDAHDFTVLKQNELLGVSDQVVNTLTSFISGIAAISLLVGGIGIMNILLASVSERTREIGIRKAIGATNRQILNQFLVEGLVLSIGGGVIGIAISFVINGFLRLYTDWRPVISLPVLFLAVSISVAAGVIFSLAPAFKAARKDPITALRGN